MRARASERASVRADACAMFNVLCALCICALSSDNASHRCAWPGCILESRLLSNVLRPLRAHGWRMNEITSSCCAAVWRCRYAVCNARHNAQAIHISLVARAARIRDAISNFWGALRVADGPRNRPQRWRCIVLAFCLQNPSEKFAINKSLCAHRMIDYMSTP